MANVKRTLSFAGRGPTRRSLFGPVDREQLQADYQDALRRDLEDASRRWSFDFVSDQPLASGHFQWEGVPVATVPLLYRTRMLGKAVDQRVTEVTVSHKRSRTASSECEKENVPESKPDKCSFNMEKTPKKKENTGLKRKQTNITDFYQAKRRVVGMSLKSDK
ncbi:cyclin-dependent kinase inhibitor 1 isoform X2 [Corythoichthys intestinalis]|nr:cyclin-dependent kinase inhibitor 1 isoform X2 [Corythoichthys intestinalis]XP_061813569.1 cyclin-dependent kinase inhibitor 1 [Nerophis lumbriciformis]